MIEESLPKFDASAPALSLAREIHQPRLSAYRDAYETLAAGKVPPYKIFYHEGPVGSGKTTLAHAAISELNSDSNTIYYVDFSGKIQAQPLTAARMIAAPLRNKGSIDERVEALFDDLVHAAEVVPGKYESQRDNFFRKIAREDKDKTHTFIFDGIEHEFELVSKLQDILFSSLSFSPNVLLIALAGRHVSPYLEYFLSGPAKAMNSGMYKDKLPPLEQVHTAGLIASLDPSLVQQSDLIHALGGGYPLNTKLLLKESPKLALPDAVNKLITYLGANEQEREVVTRNIEALAVIPTAAKMRYTTVQDLVSKHSGSAVDFKKARDIVSRLTGMHILDALKMDPAVQVLVENNLRFNNPGTYKKLIENALTYYAQEPTEEETREKLRKKLSAV